MKADRLEFDIHEPCASHRFHTGVISSGINDAGCIFVNQGRTPAAVKKKTIASLRRLLKELEQ